MIYLLIIKLSIFKISIPLIIILFCILLLFLPPAGASLQLVPNSKFKTHNLPIPLALFGALYRLEKPSAGASLQLVPNSKFIIPLALFTAHYRLEKLFSLLCIKENNRLVFCIMLIFNVINF